jgi:hypothetical protein
MGDAAVRTGRLAAASHVEMGGTIEPTKTCPLPGGHQVGGTGMLDRRNDNGRSDRKANQVCLKPRRDLRRRFDHPNHSLLVIAVNAHGLECHHTPAISRP